MSFTIYKTFPKTLKLTSAYSHYSLGAAETIKYVYSTVNFSSNYLHYHATADQEPNTTIQPVAMATTIDNFYRFAADATQNMYSVAFSTDNTVANIETDQEFYLSSEDDKIELTEANRNAPTNLVVQEIYPNSKDYTLLNGSFVTYKSNIKHKIVVGFEYIPKGTVDKFIALSKSTVIIVPELEDTVDTSPFENKAYVCNWQGSNLNFEYANPYKKAGYKGQISFLEV